jgi:signal transduction histidine kinase
MKAVRFHEYGDPGVLRTDDVEIPSPGAGEVRLRVAGNNGCVVFEVGDTGIGIAADDLERIFDAFWQVEQTTTRRVGGAGLGLSVARRLTRLLGGELRVASVPGRGSLFTLELPARNPAAGAHAA